MFVSQINCLTNIYSKAPLEPLLYTWLKVKILQINHQVLVYNNSNRNVW